MKPEFWLPNLDEAKARARATGKLILVDVWENG